VVCAIAAIDTSGTAAKDANIIILKFKTYLLIAKFNARNASLWTGGAQKQLAEGAETTHMGDPV